jgi:alpha-tubulin suppressor-like RCC1 family protein
LGYFPGYGGISTPTAVSGLPSGVVALTAGRLHTCALISTGAVTCWGHCSEFLVSGGCYANQQSAVLVEGVGEIAALSAGNFLTCFVLQSGGTVQCMGNNNNGQLGDGTKGNYRSAPTNVL